MSPAILTINLGAVQNNYRLLASKAADSASCAAVVKANAYGLGADQVVPALYQAGARDFFTAYFSEALDIHKLAPGSRFYVFNGLLPGEEQDFYVANIRPVLNDMDQIERWIAYGQTQSAGVKPAALHIDTGMARMGLDRPGLSALQKRSDLLRKIPDLLIISHLLVADDQNDPRNHEQLARFRQALATLPAAHISLANSSGIFIDPKFHFDLLRPGFALYGGNPTDTLPNPMQSVVSLQSRVLSTRRIAIGETVSYGGTWTAQKNSRLATLALGYADGFLRSQSGQAKATVNGHQVDVVGRVTMDMVVADVTDVPGDQIETGQMVSLLDDVYGVDQMADAAGTIGYEVLTNLGRRYERHYINGPTQEGQKER